MVNTGTDEPAVLPEWVRQYNAIGEVEAMMKKVAASLESKRRALADRQILLSFVQVNELLNLAHALESTLSELL